MLSLSKPEKNNSIFQLQVWKLVFIEMIILFLMWQHRWCHRAWIFMLSLELRPEFSVRRPGQKYKDNSTAIKCIASVFYWFMMNPNILSCHNAQRADREDNFRFWANFGAKFNGISFCISYLEQHTEVGYSGLHTEKHWRLTFSWCLGFCVLKAVCVCSLAGNEEPFLEEVYK